jgi:ribonuclease Z
MDVLDYHSSITDAAQTAARGGVAVLVLTHLVPPPAPGTDQEWIDQAATHFDGEVILASDLATVDVTG